MLRRNRITANVLALAVALVCTASAESNAQSQPELGIVVIAHGGGAEWNAGVLSAAEKVRATIPTEVAFLMGPAAATHRFQDQVAKLQSKGVKAIVVVPLLVSSHSGHYEQLRWLAGKTDSLDAVMAHHLHMGGLERVKTTVPMYVSRALDDAEELGNILAERAKALAPNPQQRALLLVGHGPNSAEDYAAWMDNLRRVAARVQAVTGFKDVKVELVRDDAPAMVRAEAVKRTREIITMQHQITGQDVIVVPVLIARSSVGEQKIRTDLSGLPIIYTGDPVLPHPLIADWIARRARETVQENRNATR